MEVVIQYHIKSLTISILPAQGIWQRKKQNYLLVKESSILMTNLQAKPKSSEKVQK